MKYVWMFLLLPVWAQDAVNPCAVSTETLDCSAPDGYLAEVDLRSIKLNSKRKEDQVLSGGDDLTVTARLKYTKRGKAVVTTTFIGGCPDRVESKRVKPEVDISYNAVLNVIGGATTTYTGSGLEAVIPGGALTTTSALLTVTFSVTGSSMGCLATPYPSETKIFTLTVDDGTFYGTITAGNDDEADDIDYADSKRRTTVVDDHSYFLVGQDRKLKFTADFSTLGGASAQDEDIRWSIRTNDPSVSANTLGTFTHGNEGATVKWRQGAYASAALDDVIVTATHDPPGGTKATKDFFLTYFKVDPIEVTMSTSETRQFLVPEAHIHPPAADKSVVVAILGEPEVVGSKENGVRLRTREDTGLPLGDEDFVPSEFAQWSHLGRVIKRATYQHIANTLVLELESGNNDGNYNVSWEVKRVDHNPRRHLHNVKVEVSTDPLPTVLTLVKNGTANDGPFVLLENDQLNIQAVTSAVTFPTDKPVWSIVQPAGSTLAVPANGTEVQNFEFKKAGLYVFTVDDGTETDDLEVRVYGIDLIADTDNNNGLAEAPGSQTEEDLEETSPGKLIVVGMADTDGDKIPDFADGWDRDGVPGNDDDNSTHQLVPVVLHLPEPADPTVATIEIDYNDPSEPTAVNVDFQDDALVPIFWTVAGRLRLWTDNGNSGLNKAALPAGNYLPPGTYLASDLGITAADRRVTLYMEAVKGSTNYGDESLEVTLDYDGAGPVGPFTSDKVLFSNLQLRTTPTSPVLLAGVSKNLNAVGLPAGGTYQWTVTNGAPRVTVTGAANTNTLAITGNTYSSNMNDVTLNVTYTPVLPAGTPPTTLSLEKNVPIIDIQFIRDDGDANPLDDTNLTHLEISNLVTTSKMGAGNGHTDPDNFKIQMSGPYTGAALPAGSVFLNPVKPDGTDFLLGADFLSTTLTRVGASDHFRSNYLRLVVDPWDKAAMSTQTLIVDWLSTDDTIEILGQFVDVSLSYANTTTIKRVSVGDNIRKFNVAVHWLTGTPGVTNVSARRRILRDVRRKYAQAGIKPVLNSVTQVTPPHNFVAVAHDHGNPAAGGAGTFTIDVTSTQPGGVVTWHATSAAVAGRTPLQTANQLKAALEAVAPTAGGSPGDRLVVTTFQNNAIFTANATHRSADLLIADPSGTVTSVVVASTDANQDLSAPPVTTAMVVYSGSNWLTGSVTARSMIRNFDTGNNVFDLYVSDTLNAGTLHGFSMIPGGLRVAHQRGIDPIRNNAFLSQDGMNTGTGSPATAAHEIGHALLDAIHATGNAEQVMKDSSANDNNTVTGMKRIHDGNIFFDGLGATSTTGSINQINVMRAAAMVSPAKRKSEGLTDNHGTGLSTPAAGSGQEEEGLDFILHNHLTHQTRGEVSRYVENLRKEGRLFSLQDDILERLRSDNTAELVNTLDLVARLDLAEVSNAVRRIFLSEDRRLSTRLAALRTLLQVAPSERSNRAWKQLDLQDMGHTDLTRVLELTRYQRSDTARENVTGLLRKAQSIITALKADGLQHEDITTLGVWGDIQNRAQRELMALDRVDADSSSQALVALYLTEWNTTALRLRALTQLKAQNQMAQALELVRGKQDAADDVALLHLLDLRDQLSDVLSDEELNRLKNLTVSQ